MRDALIFGGGMIAGGAFLVVICALLAKAKADEEESK
jgi:hypothetical protein